MKILLALLLLLSVPFGSTTAMQVCPDGEHVDEASGACVPDSD